MGAASGIIALAPTFSNLLAINGSSVQYTITLKPSLVNISVDFNVSIQKWPMNLDATYEHPDVVINLHDEETAKRVVRELDGVYTSDSRIKIDHDIWQTRVVDQAMKAIVERREDQRRETTTE